jgi:hypothetical protein
MEAVVPLCHVGGQPAVEVAVRQAGDLLLEGHAQAALQAPTQVKLADADREVEEEREDEKGGERPQGPQPLPGQAQLGPEIEQPSKEERLDRDRPGGGEKGGHEGQRGEQALGGDEPSHLACRSAGALLPGGGELGRKGPWRSVLPALPDIGRKGGPDPHQNGAPHLDLLLAFPVGDLAHRPVRGWDDSERAGVGPARVLEELRDRPFRLGAAAQSTGAHEHLDGPGDGIEGGERAPSRLIHRAW